MDDSEHFPMHSKGNLSGENDDTPSKFGERLFGQNYVSGKIHGKISLMESGNQYIYIYEI